MPQGMIKNPNGSFILNFAGGITKTVQGTEKIIAIEIALREGRSDRDILEIIDPSLLIERHSSGLFGVKDGMVCVNGETLPDSLSTRILDFANTELPFEPLLKFWENCKLNPDPRAKTDLYKFLEQNGHPITSDGCFIAYRAVNSNFMDKRTGKIDNSVGKIVKMDRIDVNPDPNVTCSWGLHAANFDYARNIYGSGDDILLEVKVNPANVCAIPTDYNSAKMRVCEYEVVAVNVEGIIKDRPLYDPENVEQDDEGDDGFETENSWDDDDDQDENEVSWHDANCTICNPSTESISTYDNWKTQKRDSNGRFLPKV